MLIRHDFSWEASIAESPSYIKAGINSIKSKRWKESNVSSTCQRFKQRWRHDEFIKCFPGSRIVSTAFFHESWQLALLQVLQNSRSLLG